MSEPKYVFDTNIFIILKNKYPPDISIFAKLWEGIETLFERGNDELKNWAKAHKNSFYSSDESIQNIVRDILQKFGVLVTKAKKPNGADPFVIALAKQKGCIVVTEEKRNGTDLNPKIPNICDYYNIQCIDLIDFLRENKF
jgi:hypothetical protein